MLKALFESEVLATGKGQHSWPALWVVGMYRGALVCFQDSGSAGVALRSDAHNRQLLCTHLSFPILELLP